MCTLIERRFGEGACDDVEGRVRLSPDDPRTCEVVGLLLLSPDAEACWNAAAALQVDPTTPPDTDLELRCQTELSAPVPCE
ncbi:MAG: hypothetical protein VYE22_34330 [Myxococcota bacterium]|nr:hypothetical protein [Myxococcota bacterium]